MIHGRRSADTIWILAATKAQPFSTCFWSYVGLYSRRFFFLCVFLDPSLTNNQSCIIYIYMYIYIYICCLLPPPRPTLHKYFQTYQDLADMVVEQNVRVIRESLMNARCNYQFLKPSKPSFHSRSSFYFNAKLTASSIPFTKCLVFLIY